MPRGSEIIPVMKTKIAVAAISILFLTFVADWLVAQLPRPTPNSPIYSWRFSTISGTVLGHEEGELDLMLHPHLVYVNRPNQTNKRFKINSLGFRGREPVGGSPRRLAVVGASSAFGTGLSNDDEALSFHLGNALSMEPINAGVIGYFSTQEFLSTTTQLANLKPELIVALNGANDFSRVTDQSPDLYIGSQTFDLVDGGISYSSYLRGLPLTKKIGMLHAFFFPNLDLAFRNVYKASIISVEKPRINEARLGKIEDVYVNNMVKLHLFGKATGYQTVVAIQPMEPHRNPGYQKKYVEFGGRVTKRLQAMGVNCINLSDASRILSPEDYIDEIHLFGRGYQKIASAIAPQVRGTSTGRKSGREKVSVN